MTCMKNIMTNQVRAAEQTLLEVNTQPDGLSSYEVHPRVEQYVPSALIEEFHRLRQLGIYDQAYDQMYKLGYEVPNGAHAPPVEDIINEVFLEYLAQTQVERKTGFNSELGIGYAEAYYGKPLNLNGSDGTNEIHQHALDFTRYAGMEDARDISEGAGFSRIFTNLLYDGTELTTPDEFQMGLYERVVCTETVREALEVSHRAPEDIGFAIYASTNPAVPSEGRHILTASGVGEDVPLMTTMRACNSVPRAIANLLLGRYNELIEQRNPEFANGEPVEVLFFAHDNFSSLSTGLRYNDPETGESKKKNPANHTVPQLFSSGTGAITLRIYKDPQKNALQLLGLNNADIDIDRDKDPLTIFLRASLWDSFLTGEYDPAMFEQSPFMKKPPNGEVVNIGGKAAVFVPSTIVRSIRCALGNGDFPCERHEEVVRHESPVQLGADFDPSSISTIISHHPSGKLFGRARKLIGKEIGQDLSTKMEWVIGEGNASAAAPLISLGRQLHKLSPEDIFMYLGFGAGNAYTSEILKAKKQV